MKKIFLILINLVLLFNVFSCNKKAESKAKSDFELKSAQIITDNYISFMTRKDESNAKKLLGDKIKDSGKFDDNLDIWGYKYDEIAQVGQSGNLKLFILKGTKDKAYSVLENYIIKVEKKDKEYKITEITKKPEAEVFKENTTLRIKVQDKVETKLLLNRASVPKYAVSKDDKGKTFNMETSSYNFGPIAVSYSGEQVVFSTKYNSDVYLAIVSIDTSKETASPGNEKQNQGQGNENQNQNIEGVEKPIGEKLISIDYLQKSQISLISFSTEEKFVIVGYKKTGGDSLRIYYSASGELIPYKFEDNFSMNKYNITYFGSDNKYMYFSVSTVNKESDSKTGFYRMSTEDFKVGKI